ncbi:chitobiase/beta-hexosaminidase C-terminal domain-containing protein, partial [Patescibacteria group bacterium]
NGTGEGGPADLYTYHQMQEFTFSIPSSVADGAGTMYVTVGGETSNSLDFTVRSGNIYFVKTTGDNGTGDGSWSTPWETIDYAFAGAGGTITAGDIIYVADDFTDSNGTLVTISGTQANPIAFVAYPDADVLITGMYNSGAVTLANNNNNQGYWHFSKISVDTDGTGIYPFNDMRVAGIEITGANVDGYGGAISGNDEEGDGVSGGGTFYGMYIHDFGSDADTSFFHHVLYISNRDGLINDPYEYGWCYLKDNKAVQGFHIYDQGVGGDWSGTIKIHDSVVANQKGPAINLMSGGSSITVDLEVYNNLLINNGLGPDTAAGPSGEDPVSPAKYAIAFSEATVTSDVKVYNNLIYGYGDEGDGAGVQINFGGTVDFKNNIIIDTKGLPYFAGSTPDTDDSNLFYSTYGTPPTVPAWATNSVNSNPLFEDVNNDDYTLQSGSPARDVGVSLAGTVNSSLLGISRPQNSVYDLGPFEYVVSGADTTEPTISEVTPVSTPTTDTTPNYTFTTNEAGTISYGGDCSSGTTEATSDSNTITFNTLPEGTYSNCTIIVTDSSSNPSDALSITTFVVDTTDPTTTASPSGSDYTSIQYVTLSVNETATIYYTTDGSTPTTESSTYSSPVTISETTVLKYFSVDTAGNSESINTETYTVSISTHSGVIGGFTITSTLAQPLIQSAPTFFKSITSNKQVSLSWDNPTNSNFNNVVIFRSTSPIRQNESFYISKALYQEVYTGTGEKYTEASLVNGQKYYYIVYARSVSSEYSSPLILEATPNIDISITNQVVETPFATDTNIDFNGMIYDIEDILTNEIVSTPSFEPISFTEILTVGSVDGDVTQVQQLLSQDKEIYPEGLTTGYYGELTAKAVERFQCKYLEICSGTPDTTGYGVVGPRTKAKINDVFIQRPTTQFSIKTQVFDENLSLGSSNEDVKKLQQLLSQDKEIYPEGLTTGYYGKLTLQAIKRFQEKYDIVNSGTAETTGYGVVGPKTREKLNEVFSLDLEIPTTPSVPTANVVIPETPIEAQATQEEIQTVVVNQLQEQIDFITEEVNLLIKELGELVDF